jgi:cytoskeletal protein CcmA (bactofilin family)
MSIFGRRESATSPPAPAGGASDFSSSSSSQSSAAASRQQARRLTHIAQGTRLQGEVTGATEVLIEGEVVGEVRVDSTVVVGADGLVQGPVSAQVVRIGGRVVGNVQASDRIEVAPSGTLEGDVVAPRIVIAEGAFFKGRVEMKGEHAEGSPRRSTSKGAAETAPAKSPPSSSSSSVEAGKG